MPYIPAQDRANAVHTPISPGELNYAMTKMLDAWLAYQGVSYRALNTAIGVLECVKLELYRRVAADYEDEKCAVHGDVYTCK